MLRLPKKLKTLIAICRRDPNILAFIPTGSWGKGFLNEDSDYDGQIIVRDKVLDEYGKKYEGYGYPEVEIDVKSLSQFRVAGLPGQDDYWDAYNYAHLEPLVDKTDGEIRRLIIEKARFPSKDLKNYVSGSLDAYLNSLYRSLKNHRDGLTMGSRFDAAESLFFLIKALFALHGRVAPYNKYLLWELEKFPLEKIPWNDKKLKRVFLEVLNSGNVKTQKEIAQMIEDVFKKEGYEKTFNDWKEKWDWIKE